MVKIIKMRKIPLGYLFSFLKVFDVDRYNHVRNNVNFCHHKFSISNLKIKNDFTNVMSDLLKCN